MNQPFRLSSGSPRHGKLTPEGILTKSVRRMLNTLGVWHYKHHGGLGGAPGVADIIGIYQGKFLAIELKAPRGYLSDDQRAFLETVRAQGGIAFMAKSVEDVIVGLGCQDRFPFMRLKP